MKQNKQRVDYKNELDNKLISNNLNLNDESIIK